MLLNKRYLYSRANFYLYRSTLLCPYHPGPNDSSHSYHPARFLRFSGSYTIVAGNFQLLFPPENRRSMDAWRWPWLCKRLSPLVKRRHRVNGPVEVAFVMRAVESTRWKTVSRQWASGGGLCCESGWVHSFKTVSRQRAGGGGGGLVCERLNPLV